MKLDYSKPGFRWVVDLMMFRLALLFLLIVPSVAFAQQAKDDVDGTIFAGPSFSFVLKEPDGWVIDTKTAKDLDLETVLYRKGSSWKHATAVMYARIVHKDESQSTVEDVIKNDIADFLKLSKESKVSDAASMQTRDKRKAITKEFYDAANRNYELVAFIDDAKVVVIIALSSRDKAEYDNVVPAFTSLVSSYFVFQPLVSPE